MKMNSKLENGVVYLELDGKIYIEQSALLREEMTSYTKKDHFEFVIDMSKVSYIDSSGLGALVGMHKKAASNGGSVVLKGLTGPVKQLFELTKLTSIFKIEE